MAIRTWSVLALRCLITLRPDTGFVAVLSGLNVQESTGIAEVLVTVGAVPAIRVNHSDRVQKGADSLCLKY